MSESLPIAETFASIQGEGMLAGIPSFFIRVSGCNLRCVWCDTPYASWNPEGEVQTIEDLVEQARQSGAHHIVITGGEPMMFPQIEPLCAALRRVSSDQPRASEALAHGTQCHDHRRDALPGESSTCATDSDGGRDARPPQTHVTIETAGTIFREVACDLMSISPKLSNSTPGAEHGAWARRHEERRLDFAVLQRFIDIYPQRQFKFVIIGEDDLAEVDAILAKLRGWRNEEIFLMPEGTTNPAPERRAVVLEMCRARNWRYGHRLHIELFGHARGT